MSERDSVGRFALGNPGGPGRPTKAQEMAIVQATADAFEPAQMTAYLREAMRIAIEQRSPRAIVNVLEFVRDTAVGRPGQLEKPSGGFDLSLLLASIRGIGDEAERELHGTSVSESEHARP